MADPLAASSEFLQPVMAGMKMLQDALQFRQRMQMESRMLDLRAEQREEMLKWREDAITSREKIAAAALKEKKEEFAARVPEREARTFLANARAMREDQLRTNPGQNTKINEFVGQVHRYIQLTSSDSVVQRLGPEGVERALQARTDHPESIDIPGFPGITHEQLDRASLTLNQETLAHLNQLDNGPYGLAHNKFMGLGLTPPTSTEPSPPPPTSLSPPKAPPGAPTTEAPTPAGTDLRTGLRNKFDQALDNLRGGRDVKAYRDAFRDAYLAIRKSQNFTTAQKASLYYTAVSSLGKPVVEEILK